jgi:hypothetical protein
MVAADANDIASLVKAFEVSLATVPLYIYPNRHRDLTPFLLSLISLHLSRRTELRKQLPLSRRREPIAQRLHPRPPHLSTISGVPSRITRRSLAANTPCLTLRARSRLMSTFGVIRLC